MRHGLRDKRLTQRRVGKTARLAVQHDKSWQTMRQGGMGVLRPLEHAHVGLRIAGLNSVDKILGNDLFSPDDEVLGQSGNLF